MIVVSDASPITNLAQIGRLELLDLLFGEVVRLQRLHPRKTEVRVFDYVDRDVPVLLRMFEKRLRTYRAIGYARGEAPLGFNAPGDELEGALR